MDSGTTIYSSIYELASELVDPIKRIADRPNKRRSNHEEILPRASPIDLWSQWILVLLHVHYNEVTLSRGGHISR